MITFCSILIFRLSAAGAYAVYGQCVIFRREFAKIAVFNHGREVAQPDFLDASALGAYQMMVVWRALYFFVACLVGSEAQATQQSAVDKQLQGVVDGSCRHTESGILQHS